MIRPLLLGPLWNGRNPPIPGVVLDEHHPRARGLLGFWWPSAIGFLGDSGTPSGAAVRFPDLSRYNRPAVFNVGGGQSLGAFVSTPHGPGFYIGSGGGQYGNFGVNHKYSISDWDFASGEFTLMCAVRINTLITADASQRTFCGRTDGGSNVSVRWNWNYAALAGATSQYRFYFKIHPAPFVNDYAISTVGQTLTDDRFYTVAVTRTAGKVYTFFVDGLQLGDPVTGTLDLPVPNATALQWGFGEDFGFNINGTWQWMKAWNRPLTPAEVLAERWSPWAMVRLPLGFQTIATVVEPTSPAEFIINGLRRYDWAFGPLAAAQDTALEAAYRGLHASDGAVRPIWVHRKPGDLGSVRLCEWAGDFSSRNLPSVPEQRRVDVSFVERPRTRGDETA